MSKHVTFEGVVASPSQLKTLEALREQVIAHHGEGYEYKRFEIYEFLIARILEVVIEVGKIDESPKDMIHGRILRQIFVGYRGGCELGNPQDKEKRGKIKGLTECVTALTL